MSKICMEAFALSLTVAMVVGCGQAEHAYHKKPTTKVTGRVTVDGQPPGSPVSITCHPEGEADVTNPTITQGLTDKEGAFSLSTYEQGDGVPSGDYHLTFFWGKFNAISARFSGPDRLKKRYDTPAKSPVEFSVTDTQPIDLGEISLTTK